MWREVLKKHSNSAPRCLDEALGRFAQGLLELGEDLLDRGEIGTVGWQVRTSGADRPTNGETLVADQIVYDHGVARHQRQNRRCLTQVRKLSPLIGPSSSRGASMQSWRRVARESQRLPMVVRNFREHLHAAGRPARKRVMLVLAPFSSINTTRTGSTSPRCAFQALARQVRLVLLASARANTQCPKRRTCAVLPEP